MIDFFNEAWGELYWNTSDWLPWLAVQTSFAAGLAVVAQWWFQIRWPIVFIGVLVFVLSINLYRMPASPFSKTDIANMNASLPREFDGLTINSVSFAHRVFTYEASSAELFDEQDVEKGLAEAGIVAGNCKMFGKWLATKQIKQIRYVWSWSGGSYTHVTEDRDCEKGEQR